MLKSKQKRRTEEIKRELKRASGWCELVHNFYEDGLGAVILNS